MTELTDVRYEVQEGLCWITIDRPERLNSFTAHTVEELIGCFKRAWADPAVGVVALTGSGDRAFCTGGDVRDVIGPLLKMKPKQVQSFVRDLKTGEPRKGAAPPTNAAELRKAQEKGEVVPGLIDNPDPQDRTWAYASQHPNSNRHEMLTGSQTDGRGFTDNLDHTCSNWTNSKEEGLHAVASNGGPGAQIGLSDRNGGGNGSWNSSHPTRGCSQDALATTHGVGLFYCFAIN